MYKKEEKEKISIVKVFANGFVIPVYLSIIVALVFFCTLMGISELKWLFNALVLPPYLLLSVILTLPKFPLLYIEFYFTTAIICIIIALIARISIKRSINWLIFATILVYLLAGIIILLTEPNLPLLK